MATGDIPYPKYKDERDTGQRRSGRTSRIIDFLVQEFFINGEAMCFDHSHSYPHGNDNIYRRNRAVMRMVLDRLKLEYNIPDEYLFVDTSNNIIKKIEPTQY
ncbi:MAG TPA: hypothetical protein VIY47_17080 [Ignavibacteriaceae bacterium]